MRWSGTTEDLFRRKLFDGLSATGRVEFDTSAKTGTHRTEATAGARLVIRSSTLRAGGAAISVEYSPAGFFARGFVRYGDGRDRVIEPGVEAGFTSSVKLNIDELDVFGVRGVSLGIAGRATVSTDEAFQTGNPAGTSPLIIEQGMPAGHHGIGEVTLELRF